MKDSLYEELEHVFEYNINILFDVSAEIGGKTHSKQQLGMGVYMKLAMISGLE
jgi:hypothetical protein